ncbi:hypothetical protein C2S51_020325 [Perilla frutescens var. frutescens]|nr:hypothetical protein C2S51_020325 [Perilla frutescens var. frutescens]
MHFVDLQEQSKIGDARPKTGEEIDLVLGAAAQGPPPRTPSLGPAHSRLQEAPPQVCTDARAQPRPFAARVRILPQPRHSSLGKDPCASALRRACARPPRQSHPAGAHKPAAARPFSPQAPCRRAWSHDHSPSPNLNRAPALQP